MSINGIENDTINQAKQNEIDTNDNHEIFEVPGQNKNTRRQICIVALGVYVKMPEMHEIGGLWHEIGYWMVNCLESN